MSDAAADSSSPPRRGWSRQHFFLALAAVAALHLTLIFVFGTKKPVQEIPRKPNIPHVQLVQDGNEWIALTDPTLLVRPNAHDLVSTFWRRPQAINEPNFNWTEPPQYLPPAAGDFGAAFRDFMRASQPGELPLNYKPEPKMILPGPAADAVVQATTMKITGALAQRRLLTTNAPPSLPANDVLPPSRVQVLVDATGGVASSVVLPMEGTQEDPSRGRGDAKALALAQKLRFAPAPGLTFGEIVFRWHTVPGTSTNAP